MLFPSSHDLWHLITVILFYVFFMLVFIYFRVKGLQEGICTCWLGGQFILQQDSGTIYLMSSNSLDFLQSGLLRKKCFIKQKLLTSSNRCSQRTYTDWFFCWIEFSFPSHFSEKSRHRHLGLCHTNILEFCKISFL